MKPNFKILLREGEVYVRRWYGIPQNSLCNAYIHCIQSDDNQRLHDHPWNNVSIVLSGGYFETTPNPRSLSSNVFSAPTITRWYGPGSCIFRRYNYPHRLTLARDKGGNPIPCWTLFLTGRVRRWVVHNGKRKTDWGFHTRHGWITHAKLVKMENGISHITPYGEEMMK